MKKLLYCLLLCAPLVFAIESKTFTWVPPSQNTDGSALPDAEIASYIQNATVSDELNVAIEMIGEIEDEQQRKDLLEVCDARKLKITNGET